MGQRAVAIGLDGASWHLLEPMIQTGVMPQLQRLKSGGAAGILKSTLPVFTPPAWTSCLTGVNPGRHGVYGFFAGNAQSEKPELLHSGRIRAPLLWDMTAAQGARCGIYNLPLTYPVRDIDGWMVSGMMTPGSGDQLDNFASPRELQQRIHRWAPGYVPDVTANYASDYKDAHLCRRALASLQQRRAVLEGLLDVDSPDVLFAMLEVPDRLQHVYYRYMDPADALYGHPLAASLREEIYSCFAAIDDIVGLLTDWVGPQGGVIVCSDHGFTAWDVSVHTNVLLERWGYLKLKRGARLMQTTAARGLVSLAKSRLPHSVTRPAKQLSFSVVDWPRTRAFASQVQGVCINLEGRERHGIVPPSMLEEVKTELAQRFMELRGPDGRPVTDRVWRSEEVYEGAALEGAPDLLPVLRDHRYDLDLELFHRAAFTDVSDLPRGVHHIDGIVAVHGPGVREGGETRGSVMDVAPTLLYLAGLGVPQGLDGRVLASAFESDWLEAHPVREAAVTRAAAGPADSPYTAEEEAAIEEALKGLGYL